MVVPSKANFNILLGREWIHRIGVAPSSMHQRIVIWRDDGLAENIEADQSYFLVEVNQVTRNIFERSLANIATCSAENGSTGQIDVSFVRLHPTHSLMRERDVSNTKSIVKDLIPPTRKNIENNYHV